MNIRAYIIIENLSVIFSTNESVQSTPPQSITRREIHETPENMSPVESYRSGPKENRAENNTIKKGSEQLDEVKNSARSDLSLNDDEFEVRR